MRTFLIAAGCIWFGISVVFVCALALAARRPVPTLDPAARPGARTRRSGKTKKNQKPNPDEQLVFLEP